MRLALLAAFGGILTAVTLPLVLELFLVTTAFLSRRRRQHRACAIAPHIAVIVPAHNEESLIEACVISLLESAAGTARVLVVAHNCKDRTADVAVRAGAELLIYNDEAARGKGHALRHGFNYAIKDGAEAVLVVDADSTVSRNLIPEVLRSLSEGAAAVQCRYEMQQSVNNARSRLSSLAFRAFTYIRPAGREQLGLSAGISGNGFALTASLLKKVPYEAFSVVEDLEYHIHMVMAGERVRFIENAVVSSHCPPSSTGETVQQSRWQGGRMWVARKWILPLLGQVALGRVRMLEPMLDLACLPLAYGVAALLAECLIPLPWVRMYAVASLGVVVVHVLTAAWAGPDFLGTLRMLATAPVYILWKMRLVPGILKASSQRAKWVRTDREGAVTEPAMSTPSLPQ